MYERKKYKYYHAGDFNMIQKLVSDGRFETARVEYEKYLEKYPKDVCANAYYVDILIKLGMLEKASEELNGIIVISKTPELSKQDIEIMKLKLFSCLQEYDKCLEIVRENFEVLEQRNWNTTELLLFFKKQLGLLVTDDYSGYNYKISQITNYSEEAAIECIKKNHTVSDDFCPLAYFNQDFDIEDMYYKIREMLPLEDRINDNFIENIYSFKYVNNGRVYNKSVDYIRVVVLQGTNDIITMYPYRSKEKLSCIDLTPVEEYPKVKRMGQIEKFNQRYNR